MVSLTAPSRVAGPITFETFSSAVVAEGLSHDLAIWRNLWTDGAAKARPSSSRR